MPTSKKNQRLSQTSLWEMQSAAYQTLGLEAWTKRGIPSYLTCNPFIAKRYAQMAFDYLLQEHLLKRLSNRAIFTIFEFGAGTGRFAYLFLKYFLHLVAQSPLKGQKIRYVMSDLSPEVIAGWKEHPHLQKFFDSGILDCACLDLSKPAPFQLMNSGFQVAEGALDNPCVLITNYLFGYLKSDLFANGKGGLAEGLVTIDTKGINSATSAQAEDLTYSTRFRPLAKKPYYEVKEWNSALSAVSKELPETSFTLPIGAFELLDFFRNVSPKGYCLLAADRGAVTPEQIVALQGISVSRNALCAVAINCRALIHYFKQRGELACSTLQPHPTFVVMMAVAGDPKRNNAMVQRTFSNQLSDFEPADYWELVNLLEKRDLAPKLEEIYLLLKLGDWDSSNFYIFFESIRKELKNASQLTRKRWVEIVDYVYDNFFPLSESEANLIVNMGVLLFDLKHFAKALIFFQRAYLFKGDRARIFFNMGLCYSQLKDQASAKSCFAEAEKLDASFDLSLQKIDR